MRTRIVVVAALVAGGLGLGAAPDAVADTRSGVVCQVTYEATRAGAFASVRGSGTCVGVDGGVYTATLSPFSTPVRQGCPGAISFQLLVQDNSTGVGTLRSLVWDPYLVPSAQAVVPPLLPPGALPLTLSTPHAFAGSLVPSGFRMVSVANHLCLANNDVEWHTSGVGVIELGAVAV
jgi:hypothetical protein